MNNRAKFIATVGASGLAGALVATLVLAIEFSADLHNFMDAGHDQASVVRLFSATSDVPQPTFYSEMAQANARMHDSMEILPSGDADRDFIQMMIPLHQGAIDMALVLLKYGHDERLKRLAQSIIVAQGQEIVYMRTLHNTSPGEASSTRSISQ
jgi:uncharacterized protein (DUF305 family)